MRLPPGWQAYAVVLSLPLWWLLGVSDFIWPLISFPLLLALAWRGRISAPPLFWLWLLFLAWMLASGTRVEGDWRWLAFAYRVLLYVSASLLFLYVFNASKADLPDGAVVGALSAFWAAVALGGFLALAFPELEFRTLAERWMPPELLRNEFVYAMVHRGLADVNTFMGYPVPRPKTFFAYTNAWGASFALLVPCVLACVANCRHRARKVALAVLLVASSVPFVFSLNRGAWLSLGVGLAYAVVRLALGGNLRALAGLAGAVGAVAALIWLTPLGELAVDRLEHPHSDAGRLSLYGEALERSQAALVLGYGAPRPSLENPTLPSVGTHGQLLLVLFSHGVVGLAFFLGWFLYTLWRSGSEGAPVRFWMHVVILVALVQAPYYELLPVPLHIVMVAAAVAWRDLLSPGEEVPGGAGIPGGARAPVP